MYDEENRNANIGNGWDPQESRGEEPSYLESRGEEPSYRESREEPSYQDDQARISGEAAYSAERDEAGAERSRIREAIPETGSRYGGSFRPDPVSPQPAGPSGPSGKKKKSAVIKRYAGVALAALMFGVIAGSVMAGMNLLAGRMQEKQEDAAVPQISTQAALSDDEIQRIARRVTGSVEGTDGKAVLLDVSGIVEDAMPSIVAIDSKVVYESVNPWFGRQTYEATGSGSGIIIGENDKELLVVTNNHVVEDTTELTVTFIDKTAVNATVKGTDSESDVAIISIPLDDISQETKDAIAVAMVGNYDDLEVGQGVVAIGNALGYGQSVTVGYISALDREVNTESGVKRNLLQTDAAINPGNSGGALLNMYGEVIGINVGKYTDTSVEGMGYAIPISEVEDVINALMARRSGEKVEEGKEGYLGIQGVTVDSSMQQQLGMPEGVYVYRILDGGAASKTDLREKDIITGFDGQTIRSMQELQDLLKYYKIGETVDLTVQSLDMGAYVERTVTVTLAAQANS